MIKKLITTFVTLFYYKWENLESTSNPFEHYKYILHQMITDNYFRF